MNETKLPEASGQELNHLIQNLSDLCHEKYTGCYKARNTGNTNIDYDYSYTDEVINMLDTSKARTIILSYQEAAKREVRLSVLDIVQNIFTGSEDFYVEPGVKMNLTIGQIKQFRDGIAELKKSFELQFKLKTDEHDL